MRTFAFGALWLLACAFAHAETRYTQVTAGQFHTCALTTEGAVKCWGSDNAGQLGDGKSDTRSAPDYVSGLTSGVASIAAGNSHTCAVMTTGAVKCWGQNDFGQTGGSAEWAQRTPADVPGLGSGVAAVSAGLRHSCAVMTSGALKCWGVNPFGELGDGTRTGHATPVQVSGLESGVLAVSAGEFFTCAIAAPGVAKCWGENYLSRLGNGGTVDRSTPEDVIGIPGRVVSISARYNNACAVNEPGNVYCWGMTSYADGPTGNVIGTVTSTARLIPGGSDAMEVQVGETHACARTSLGGVKCYGVNFDGQLGIDPGRNRIRNDFSDVQIIDVASLGIGYQHSCALLRSGAIKCWGWDGYGQAGSGRTDNTIFAQNPVPTTVVEGRAAPAGANFQGLWWNSAQPGWGINLAHQGDILFAAVFVYDTDKKPMWLVMSRGDRVAPGRYAGDLYRTTGPAFSVTQWNSANVAVIPMGSAVFEFSGPTSGTFSYFYGSDSGSNPISLQEFATPRPACGPGLTAGARTNYQDLWWASPPGSESGWGVNIAHQGDIFFATWFTYDASGRGQWLVMSDGRRNGTETWSGTLYRTAGSAFGTQWIDSQRALTAVGSATFGFSDASHGTFTYTLDGVTRAKPITRQQFSTPGTLCVS